MSEETLIDGYTFLVSESDGTLGASGGLYHRDARHLSDLSVDLDGADLALLDADRPVPWRRHLRYADLDSTVNEIGDSAAQKYTAVVVDREQTVREAVGLRERCWVRNYARSRRSVALSVSFDADFADLFEVRGIEAGLDRAVESSVGDRRVTYSHSYPVGSATADDTSESTRETRSTSVAFDEGFAVEDGTATAALELASGETATLDFAVGPGVSTPEAFPASGASRPPQRVSSVVTALDAAGSPYAGTFGRCASELTALVTETDSGAVPLAGVPWFATQFGRDAVLTAYQSLPAWPALARGTLRFLAARQGATEDETRGEEPGKLFHELRRGELARRGEIRHTPYYASADVTPLWVVLLHETHRWLGDDDLLADCWPTAEAALDWVARAADRDPAPDDPFVYYGRPAAEGLEHAGWKDTAFAVQFADGTPADPPLASVEVQGYAYDAYRRGAALARERGRESAADEYERRADELLSAFADAFWMPDRGFHAAALTADGERVDSKTSNVGHCLWSGIVAPERARQVADGLLAPDLFSGWGVRTLSTDSGGYSPVSYHAGSVWPHDSALVALGLARYGFADDAERISRAVLDASRHFGGTLPELFCGFGDGDPVRYPASCEPQAWSAATPFALLRASFALDPDRRGTPRIGNVPDSLPTRAVRPLLRPEGSVGSRDDGWPFG